MDILPSKLLNVPITIVGAGAIGSWAALILSKAGFSALGVVDFDKVEIENLNSQFFSLKHDVDEFKVVALQRNIEWLTSQKVSINTEKYEKGAYDGIVVCAVDSMEVRKTLWEEHKNHAGTIALIDPRMSAEFASLYVMKPSRTADHEDYPKTLHSDKDSVQERCTAKATGYTASLLAGLVVKAVKDLVTGTPYARVTLWDIGKHAMEVHTNKE